MNIFNRVAQPLTWLMALLLTAFVAGCGSSGGDAIVGGGGSGTTSSTKAITTYSLTAFPAALVTIDEALKTIQVIVPNGTAVTALVSTFTSTGSGSPTVGSVNQVSGTTANDFTSPVVYTVTATDGTTATYTVTVTAAAASAKAISSYSFAAYPSSIGTITGSGTTFAIAVTVPNGTAVTNLVATFATTGTGVTVAATAQTSGTTAHDFTNPVVYTVTAGDGTTATYTVTVTVASSTAKAITAFSFAAYPGAAGTITGSVSPFAIAVALPTGATLTGRTAVFVTTGASVTVAGVAQVSGTTVNDFSSPPVAYTVHAADGTTAIYNVTVTVAAGATSVLPGVAGTTGANATNPTVNTANPSDLDINVPTSTRGYIHTNLVDVKVLTATFNEAMDPATITPVGAFTLKETISGTNVPGTVTMNAASTIATFTPVANLSPGVSYTATISTAAKNAGSLAAMPKAVAWSFTTRAASAANQANPFVGQAPIDLLTAGNFAILAKTAITETGTFASVITGNVGLSTGAASAIGIRCSEVGIYTIYGVDPGYTGNGGLTACFKGTAAPDITLVNNAVADMATAYGEAAARTVPDAINLGVANIGGQTIYPGLYKWTGALGISGGNVTLDAQGDSNAVWIFQIAGDLTVPSSGALPGIQVILAGKAKASNIFWQVAASSFGATLGTYNTFNGNILSSAQVILQTGTVLNGRAMATTQVVLDANPVTKPAP